MSKNTYCLTTVLFFFFNVTIAIVSRTKVYILQENVRISNKSRTFLNGPYRAWSILECSVLCERAFQCDTAEFDEKIFLCAPFEDSPTNVVFTFKNIGVSVITGTILVALFYLFTFWFISYRQSYHISYFCTTYTVLFNFFPVFALQLLKRTLSLIKHSKRPIEYWTLMQTKFSAFLWLFFFIFSSTDFSFSSGKGLCFVMQTSPNNGLADQIGFKTIPGQS